MVDQDLGSSPFVWLLRPMLVPVLGLSLLIPTRYPACPRLESELQRQMCGGPPRPPSEDIPIAARTSLGVTSTLGRFPFPKASFVPWPTLHSGP